MDDAARQFRRQASRELGDRRWVRRRYSRGLRQEAVAYWRARERAGDGLHEAATALGVTAVSLRRWAQAARFRSVQVVPDAGPVARVVVIVGEGVRVEGLDVETAAQLIARLR